MVGCMASQGVSTSADVENNSNQKKYTVNKKKGAPLQISKSLCTLMAIGALLLAILVGLVVFFLVPRCHGEAPASLVQSQNRKSLLQEELEERLPKHVRPTHYRIQLAPNLEDDGFAGTMSIHLNVEEPTNLIIFNLDDLIIDERSVSVREVQINKTSPNLEISTMEYGKNQQFTVKLGVFLKKNGNYTLDLAFKGVLNGVLRGFYKSTFVDIASNSNRFALITQFSPTDARRAFPCWDEPSFKARFSISLARPSNMSTLSNMPLSKSDNFVQRPDWYWDHFEETPVMPTYLVAFIVSDLVSTQTSHPTMKIWSRNNLQNQTEYASEISPRILRFFESYFNIAFPLPKIDIVAVPEFGFGAMENWGLITFRESSLLFDPNSTAIIDKRTIAVIITHEMAHQWFGNLVTPKWWDDLWLKEGFATYLEYVGVNFVEPSWNILEEFLPSEIDRAFSLDALECASPISSKMLSNKQIQRSFNAISYSKGAAIIRMMSSFLGDNAFKSGLITFLGQHKFKNADRSDLFDSLTYEAHKQDVLEKNVSVEEVMLSWTEQAGFPVVQASLNRDAGVLELSQRRFLWNNNKSLSSWWVPVSITTAQEQDFKDPKPKVWLKNQTAVFYPMKLAPQEWYLLNLNKTGYFIVNYDEENWRSLLANIMNLPTITRTQLISDSMDLARANLLDYDIPLRLIGRMAANDQQIMFVPTLTAFKKLEFLKDILTNSPVYGLFMRYVWEIFRDTYLLVESSNRPGPLVPKDYFSQRISHTVMEWACLKAESDCTHSSIVAFRDWMNGAQIQSHLKDIIYCTAIREGFEREWEFAYESYEISQSPSDKNALLDALGCTKLKWLLSRYLDKLLTAHSIRIQDADRVFKSVARNQYGTAIAFDFLRTNWKELQLRFGQGFNILPSMIQSLAPHLNTKYQLQELELFRDSLQLNGTTSCNAFDSTIELVRSNVQWMERSYDSVAKWLELHKERYTYV